MPVIGRFRLRRESRRAFLRSWVRCVVLQKILLTTRFFAAQKFLCTISKSILGSTCFFLHAQQALHPIMPLATFDYFRGRSLTDEIAS